MAGHRNLSGAQLHEPKGVENATSGQVYVANGAGSGTWTTLSSVTPPIIKYKDGDTTKNNTTFADDADLFGFQLSASTTYKVEGDLYWNNATGGTAGIKFTFQVASGSLTGSQIFWTNFDPDNDAILSSGEKTMTDTFTVAATSAAGYSHTRVSGYVVVNSAAVIDLQFAQDATDGSNVTTLYQGSHITFTRVS